MNLMKLVVWTAGTRVSLHPFTRAHSQSLCRGDAWHSQNCKRTFRRRGHGQAPGKAEWRQEGSTGCGDGRPMLSCPAVKAERSDFTRALFPETQACQVLMTKTRWQMTRGLGGQWLSHPVLESQLCQSSAGLQRITLTPQQLW